MTVQVHDSGFSREPRINSPGILWWRAAVLQVLEQATPTRTERVRSALERSAESSKDKSWITEEVLWETQPPAGYNLPIDVSWKQIKPRIRLISLILGVLLTVYGLANVGLDLRRASILKAEEMTGSAAALPVKAADDFSFTVPVWGASEENKSLSDTNQPAELAAPPMPTMLPLESAQEPKIRDEAEKQAVSQPSLAEVIKPEKPLRLVIPAINMDAPVVPAESSFVTVMGKKFQQWDAPNKYAAGWHLDSAKLGESGNTVLNGHNNIYGEVFAHLEDLKPGDIIQVYGEKHLFSYRIANVMILPEKYENLDVRSQNAQWIMPSKDERLTLVSCWPYNNNTHRLIVVASPASREEIRKLLR